VPGDYKLVFLNSGKFFFQVVCGDVAENWRTRNTLCFSMMAFQEPSL